MKDEPDRPGAMNVLRSKEVESHGDTAQVSGNEAATVPDDEDEYTIEKLVDHEPQTDGTNLYWLQWY